MFKTLESKINLASGLLWFLQLIALAIHLLFIPATASHLAAVYVEYSGDAVTIQVLLSLIVVSSQVVLWAVWKLLERIKTRQLLDASSIGDVRLLASGSFAVSAFFFALMVWLIVKNTLPPSLSAGLIVAMVVGVTVGLATMALKQVLLEAIAARDELEGVI